MAKDEWKQPLSEDADASVLSPDMDGGSRPVLAFSSPRSRRQPDGAHMPVSADVPRNESVENAVITSEIAELNVVLLKSLKLSARSLPGDESVQGAAVSANG